MNAKIQNEKEIVFVILNMENETTNSEMKKSGNTDYYCPSWPFNMYYITQIFLILSVN